MTSSLEAVRPELEAIAANNGAGSRAGALRVTFDAKSKLILPDVPARGDVAGQCAWLTCAFNLDSAHPITGGAWQGVRGPDGHIALHRAAAPDIRFEPARYVNTPVKLVESFTGRRYADDGMLHAYKSEHCRQISHVIACLCDTADALTEEQEAGGIIGTFTSSAVAVEGLSTYGTTAQRYEAAIGLRRAVDEINGRPAGAPRYLIDANTGETVIAVSDLSDAARRHIGSSVPRGWLDARMANLQWARITLEGYGLQGRAGRKGPHARINAYRGHQQPVADQGEAEPAKQPESANT